VHEGVASMIAKQDMMKMKFVIESQLFPMMIRNGFDLSGCTFDFDTTEAISIKDKAAIDASFMPYVKFDTEYLEHTYHIELSDEVDTAQKIKNLYK
jgi:hypothetical protein